MVDRLKTLQAESVIYIVGTLWNYTDVRHFALHRIREAHLLESPCRHPKGFDLDAYLGEQQEFSYPPVPARSG